MERRIIRHAGLRLPRRSFSANTARPAEAPPRWTPRPAASSPTTPADQRHIQRRLSANCFGDYLTRAGLDIPTCELLTLSMLLAFGGCDPQVKGHVAGNRNVGNDCARLIDVVTQLAPFIGYLRTLNGLRAVDEVAPP